MRQPHTTPRPSTAAVYPWMKQIQEIRSLAISADSPDQGADLFQLLETRQFRRATTDNGITLKAHEQELTTFSAAIDAELQLAARSAPERMNVSQITQLLRLEQRLVTRLSCGQSWVKRTQNMTDQLRDIQSTMSRELQTTRLIVRPLIELLDQEARLLKSQLTPLEYWYWLLIDTTSGLDDVSPIKRQIFRPILNAMRLAAMLSDQPLIIREELLLATILCDLPLIARVFRPSRRSLSEQELDQTRKTHATAAVALATGISDLPSGLLSLIGQHHQSASVSSGATSSGMLRPLTTLQTIISLADLLASHQARLPLHEVPLSADPTTLTMFQHSVQVAVTAGQLSNVPLQQVLKPLRFDEALAAIPESSSTPETPLQRLQRLLQQNHLRLDPPETIRAPLFQVTGKRDRKRRLSSYPGPKKRV